MTTSFHEKLVYYIKWHIFTKAREIHLSHRLKPVLFGDSYSCLSGLIMVVQQKGTKSLLLWLVVEMLGIGLKWGVLYSEG